ncbi:MAG: glycosyl transferase family 1 [Paludibacter sp.]|nr:glycosyl transferase family 1 [Paludibacter sp.]
MKRVFICQVVPKNLTSKFVVSQAANNFCFNLIDNNCFDEVKSLVPTNIISKIISDENDSSIEYIQCRYFKRHKGVLKLINSILESFNLAYSTKSAKNIWVYNITPHNLLSCLLIKFLFHKNIFLLLADYTPSGNTFSVQGFIKYFIEHKVSGIISLSSRNEFNHKNMTSLAGIVPENMIFDTKPLQPINNDFLLSGRLEESTGLSLAINAFSKIKNVNLYITGRLNDEIIGEIEKYPNIKYLGLLNYVDYLSLLHKIPFSLNLRNPSFEKNLNNFPSKVLEAFSYSKIVISTIKYPELNGFKYFHCLYSEESLIETINDILISDYIELAKYANHSEQLKITFSEDCWKSTINEIEKIK